MVTTGIHLLIAWSKRCCVRLQVGLEIIPSDLLAPDLVEVFRRRDLPRRTQLTVAMEKCSAVANGCWGKKKDGD